MRAVTAISTADHEGDPIPLSALTAFLDRYFKNDPIVLVQLGDLVDKGPAFPKAAQFFLNNPQAINIGGNRDYNKIRLAQLNRRDILRMLAAEIYYHDELIKRDESGNLCYLNGVDRAKAIDRFYTIGDLKGKENYAHYLSWVDGGPSQTLLEFFQEKYRNKLDQILADRADKSAKDLERELSAVFPKESLEEVKDLESDVLYWMLTHTMGTRRGRLDSYAITFAETLKLDGNTPYDQLTRDQKHDILAEYQKSIRPGGDLYKLIRWARLFVYFNGALYTHGFPPSLSAIKKMAEFLDVQPSAERPEVVGYLIAIEREFQRIITDYFNQLESTGETAFTDAMQRLQYLLLPIAANMTSIQTQTPYGIVQEGVGVPLICGHQPIASGPVAVRTKEGKLVSLTDSQNSRHQPEQAGGYIAINTATLRLSLKLNAEGKVTDAYLAFMQDPYDINLHSLPEGLKNDIISLPKFRHLHELDKKVLDLIGMPVLVDPHFKPIIEQHGLGLPKFVQAPATAFVQKVFLEAGKLIYEVHTLNPSRAAGFLAKPYLVPANAVLPIDLSLQPRIEEDWAANEEVQTFIDNINKALDDSELKATKINDIKRALLPEQEVKMTNEAEWFRSAFLAIKSAQENLGIDPPQHSFTC